MAADLRELRLPEGFLASSLGDSQDSQNLRASPERVSEKQVVEDVGLVVLL